MVLMLVLDAQIAILIQHAKMIVNAGIINYFCYIIIFLIVMMVCLISSDTSSVTSYIVYYFILVIKNCFFFFFWLWASSLFFIFVWCLWYLFPQILSVPVFYPFVSSLLATWHLWYTFVLMGHSILLSTWHRCCYNSSFNF